MFTKSWRRSAFAFKSVLTVGLALLALFCMVRSASAEEATEDSVQIDVYLTDAWSGVEFSLTTSEGLYDGIFTVGSDGALSAIVPAGDYYMFTSDDILESTPAMPDKVATTETNEVTGSSVSETEISIFLGEDWTGAVFNVATDLSVFPNGFAVDETGYLTVQVDDSNTYVISVATVAETEDEAETTDTTATETIEATEEANEVTESTGTEETHAAEQTEDTNTVEESADTSEDTAVDAEGEDASEEDAGGSETTGVLGFFQNNPFTLVYFVGLIVIIIVFIVLKVRNRNSGYEYDDDEEEEDDE